MQGKVVLVTGAAGGIGAAAALLFATEGAAHVALADRDADRLKASAGVVRDSGGSASVHAFDVTDEAAVAAWVDGVAAAQGRIDCAFNNAGISGGRERRLTADYLDEDWDRVISINLKGVWLCMKAEIPQMLKQGSGAIVNTASIAGLVGLTGTVAYVAAKHGVTGLTKAAAMEYSSSGIRVNAVCPGYIHTPMVQGIFDENEGYEDRVASRHPIGRLGEPSEIATAVVWLSSDAASFVTGHNLPVDGGYMAQ